MKALPFWISILLCGLLPQSFQTNLDETTDRLFLPKKQAEFSIDAYPSIRIENHQDDSYGKEENSHNYSPIEYFRYNRNRKKDTLTNQSNFLSYLQLYFPSVFDFKVKNQNISFCEGRSDNDQCDIHTKELINTIETAQCNMLQHNFFLIQEYQQKNDSLLNATVDFVEEKEEKKRELDDPTLQKYLNGSYQSMLEVIIILDSFSFS